MKDNRKLYKRIEELEHSVITALKQEEAAQKIVNADDEIIAEKDKTIKALEIKLKLEKAFGKDEHEIVKALKAEKKRLKEEGLTTTGKFINLEPSLTATEAKAIIEKHKYCKQYHKVNGEIWSCLDVVLKEFADIFKAKGEKL